MWHPHARSDPYQRFVLVWLVILILMITGSVALFFGYTAGPDHADEAAELRLYGWILTSCGVAAYLMKKLAQWWNNR